MSSAERHASPRHDSPRSDPQAIVFAAASRLLDYPRPEARVEVGAVAEAVASLPPGEPRRHLESFLHWWLRLGPRDREEVYVAAFELNARASLYLTARQRGDKRYRGQQLLALREEYRRHGLEATGVELPDYLPLVLEFAAAVPAGRRVLERERQALDELQRSLATIESPFVEIVAAVLEIVPEADLGSGSGHQSPRRPSGGAS